MQEQDAQRSNSAGKPEIEGLEEGGIAENALLPKYVEKTGIFTA